MMTSPGLDAMTIDTKLVDHTRHQVAVRLLPFLFLLYVINYLDRTSLAYATLGMSRELGFSDRIVGLGAGIFFVSYVALQIPGAMMIERWGARRSIAAIMMVWGSLTVLTALVRSPGQLYLARFALGAAEAAFFPGVVLYLSHWFIREDRAKASSNFMAAIPISFVIGSMLAGWILGRSWLGGQGWRWLFVFEGLPAVLLGVAALFYLTDWPHQAAWLTPGQRDWIKRRLEEEKPPGRPTTTVGQALRSRLVLLLASVTFLEYLAAYSFVFWFPTILKRWSGLSDARLGWIGAVPYVVCFAAMLINGWHSDRSGERRWHAAVPQFAGAAALLALLTLPASTPLVVAWFSVVGCMFAFLPVFWALTTEVLSATVAAAAFGMINAVGSAAGFAGPYAFGYLRAQTGSFSYGLAMMMISALAGGLVVLCAPGGRSRERGASRG